MKIKKIELKRVFLNYAVRCQTLTIIRAPLTSRLALEVPSDEVWPDQSREASKVADEIYLKEPACIVPTVPVDLNAPVVPPLIVLLKYCSVPLIFMDPRVCVWANKGTNGVLLPTGAPV